MRVLDFLPFIAASSGGPIRTTIANSRALHAAEPSLRSVLLTTDSELTSPWQDEVRECLPSGMDMLVMPSVGRHTHIFSKRLLTWLSDNVHSFDLVVVQLLFHPLSTLCSLAARRSGVPYVIVPNGTLSAYTFAHRRRIAKAFYHRIVDRETLAGASQIRFTSESEQTDAARLGLATPGRVIPYPHRPMPRAGGSAREPATVLFLGRLHPIKGIENLLRAFAGVLADDPSVTLIVAGSGTRSYEREVRRLVSHLHLSRGVELLGFVDQDTKERLLKTASVFILPSLYKSYGLAAVEAMGAGLPVVITRGVGVWRMVRDYKAGLISESAPGQLARAILDLLDDPVERRRMGDAGFRLVREQLAPEMIAPQVLSMYRDVVDAGPPRC